MARLHARRSEAIQKAESEGARDLAKDPRSRASQAQRHWTRISKLGPDAQSQYRHLRAKGVSPAQAEKRVRKYLQQKTGSAAL